MSIYKSRPYTNLIALSTETTSSQIDGRNGASFSPYHWPEHNNAKRKRDSEDELLLHSTQHQGMPLSMPDDFHWLSEYLCFMRAQCLEVFEATQADVTSRKKSKKVRKGQVGIRCRFCAHISYERRVGRSSSFPSSKSRIYQSITMMLREHFGYCKAMPLEIKERYLSLKENRSQGAIDSKKHWVESASRLGLVDTTDGLRFQC